MTLDEAKEHLLLSITPEGLHCDMWSLYLDWKTGQNLITLDGNFKVEDLKAILMYVETANIAWILGEAL